MKLRWFNNLKVEKVILSSTIFILLIVAIAGGSISFGTLTIDNFNKFYEKEFMPVRHLNRIMRDILQIRINMLQQYLAAQAGNWKEVDKRQEQTKELAVNYMKRWQQYKETLFSDEGRAMAREWENLVAKPQVFRKNFIESLYSRQFAKANHNLQQWAESYRLLRDKTDELIKSKTTFAEQDKAIIIANAVKTRKMNIIILFAAVFASIVITIVLSRSVSGPVKLGLEFANSLAKGDFKQRIKLDQKDELGMLGSALNDAAARLENIIGQIQVFSQNLSCGDLTGRIKAENSNDLGMLGTVANALNHSADNLEKLISDLIIASENLSQAVEQIASGNQNLSQRTSEQASSLEEIASTIEEATAAINQNSENAVKAKQFTEEGAVKSVQTNGIALEAVTSINEMNESSKRSWISSR